MLAAETNTTIYHLTIDHGRTDGNGLNLETSTSEDRDEILKEYEQSRIEGLNSIALECVIRDGKLLFTNDISNDLEREIRERVLADFDGELQPVFDVFFQDLSASAELEEAKIEHLAQCRDHADLISDFHASR